MGNVNITGYYYRATDNQSFITYSDGEKEYLTNGICEWEPTAARMAQLESNQEKCDLNVIYKYLQEYFP